MLTVPNVALRFEPTVVRAVMITTAMSAAIKPYSIAVAPVSSLMNEVITDTMNAILIVATPS